MGRYGNYFGSDTPRAKNIIERGVFVKMNETEQTF